MANKYLFSILLFFTNGEGDEAMPSSFAICYMVIEASNVLLEVLIASLFLASGTEKEATFLMAIKFLIAIGSLSTCANGEHATPPSCTSNGIYNTLL